MGNALAQNGSVHELSLQCACAKFVCSRALFATTCIRQKDVAFRFDKVPSMIDLSVGILEIHSAPFFGMSSRFGDSRLGHSSSCGAFVSGSGIIDPSAGIYYFGVGVMYLVAGMYDNSTRRKDARARI